MNVDFCMSLGGSCSSAIQLRRRGLRIAALPFDWLIHQEPTTLDRQLELVRDGGKGWLDCPALLSEEQLYHGRNLGRWQYRDTATGFDLLHDFHCDIAEQPRFLADVKGVYARRYARLMKWMDQAREVLLVLDVGYALDNKRLMQLLNDWGQLFPRVRFTLFAVLWSQAEDDRFEAPGLFVRRLRRPKHLYDNEATTPVWDFLDDVQLSGKIGADSHPAGPQSRIPLFYRLLRLMFLGSRKLLRRGGYISTVE